MEPETILEPLRKLGRGLRPFTWGGLLTDLVVNHNHSSLFPVWVDYLLMGGLVFAWTTEHFTHWLKHRADPAPWQADL